MSLLDDMDDLLAVDSTADKGCVSWRVDEDNAPLPHPPLSAQHSPGCAHNHHHHQTNNKTQAGQRDEGAAGHHQPALAA